jgi:hypothetical protein
MLIVYSLDKENCMTWDKYVGVRDVSAQIRFYRYWSKMFLVSNKNLLSKSYAYVSKDAYASYDFA